MSAAVAASPGAQQACDFYDSYDDGANAYLAHLNRLVQAGWEEAEWTRRLLLSDLHAISYKIPRNDTADRSPVAVIIDVNLQNIVMEQQCLTFRDLLYSNTKKDPVRNFVQSLHAPVTDLHTRILLLSTGDNFGTAWPVDSLRRTFISHILGYELELRPAHVLSLLLDNDHLFFQHNGFEQPGPSLDHDSKYRFNLGSSVRIQFEKHSFGAFETFLSIVTVDDTLMASFGDLIKNWKLACAIALPTPPTPSQMAQLPPQADVTKQSLPTSGLLVISRAIALGSWRQTPTKADTPRLHWLGAVLDLTSTAWWTEIDDLFVREGYNLKELAAQWDTLIDASGFAQDDKSTLAAFLSLLPSECAKDVDLQVKELESSERQALLLSQRFMAMQSQFTAAKSAEDSQRVMLITYLAFVFVPVSLASSIFGMNVQQINASGHSIWTFVVTAVVMIAVAAAAFPALRWGTKKFWGGRGK